MKLYFAPRTRAIRPRWLLEELAVPYELVRVDVSKKENEAPGFLALHPFGELPVLVDGDVTLFEAPAICLYLADRFPERKLAPPPGSPERGDYLQWLLFAELTLEPAIVAASQNAQAGSARARFERILEVVERRLAGQEVLAGNAFTAADLVLASILHRAHALKLLEGHQSLVDYVMRHAQRPAVRRALAG